MFRPIPMMRLSLIVLARDERKVLMHLGRQGILHLTRTHVDPDTETVRKPSDSLSISEKLAQCDDLLTRCGKLRQALAKNAPDAEDGVPPLKDHRFVTTNGGTASSPSVFNGSDPSLPDAAEVPALSLVEGLSQLETQAGELLTSRQRLLSRGTELDSLCERASKYREFDLPLDRLDRSSFLHFVIGSLPSDNLETLQGRLGANVVVLPTSQEEGQQPVIIMTTPRRRPDLDRLLQELDFHPESLPSTEGLDTGTLYRQSLRDREQVGKEVEQTERDIRLFSSTTAQSLAAIENRVDLERRLLEASQNFTCTESSVLLSGWIPESDAPPLVDAVKTLTHGQCVIETNAPDPAAGDPVPVLLRPSRWLRPFSRLVAAYGLPEYWELEPTLFVAISYIVMFGMMFGDAGQGAILALGGLAALRMGRSSKTQDVGLLLLLGGLSSIVFGILYGSYFGIPGLKTLALWRDPLEGDPMDLMLAAVGMGVIVLSLGLILNIVNRFRQNDALGGFLGRFGIAGLLFYWGALMLLAKSTAIRSHGLMTIALILFLALPMAGWILKGPIEQVLRRRAKPFEGKAEGWVGVVSESVIGAFEGVLMYLANTTSFVRLAAYAMSHAALLMAVFTVADGLKHSVPFGGAWGLLVVILGNAVAIVLEGIIAAVQALRLEYYEFFGKFFSGTGQPFTPFRLLRQ